MKDKRNLTALVVYESFFGNTEHIARAVTEGLELEGMSAEIMDAARADHADLDSYDLLVVGGPTHAFALSRPSSREDAVTRGGDSRYSAKGLREWLSALPVREGEHLAAAFDTRVSKVRHLPASAARSATHLLRQRRFTLVGRPAGFVVMDIEGPLDRHETERAVSWGRWLARETQDRVAARHTMRA
jgi:Flavodoxin